VAVSADSATDAYDRLAAVYDDCNASNDYEMWLGEALLPELERHGLQLGWALDVGCGTGRAFDPLLARGWHVLGCDVSSQMLAEAGRKFGPRVPLLHLDARDLPAICPAPGLPTGEAFTLVLLLNDVLNYLTEDGDLDQAFAGVKGNLSRPDGLVAFDVNTLSLFRDEFVVGVVEEMGSGGWEWRGLTERAEAGAIYEARLSGRGLKPNVHRQRHWTSDEIRSALEAAGLHSVASLGQREEGGQVVLSDPPDEERDAKVIYVASL
jgi:SAM-dependent methyltransferase